MGLILLMGCRRATGPGAVPQMPTVRVVKPIVRQITEAHGGQVRVRSTPGEGSTFTVALPISEG